MATIIMVMAVMTAEAAETGTAEAAAVVIEEAVVVEGIVNAVSRLMEDHVFRQRIGRAARREVEEKYNLRNWNAALKAVFDKARAAG